MRPRRLPALALVLVVTITGCSLVAQPPATPIVRGGWAWPVPAPLPPGAIAVPIDVSPIWDMPADAVIGCPAALLGPVTPEHRPGGTPPVVYRVEGREVLVRWPVGFSARLAPHLEIVAPDGMVIARAGETTKGLGGGYTGGDAFHVCTGDWPKRVGAPG